MNQRQIGLFLLKLCLAAGILALVFRRVDAHAMLKCLAGVKLPFIIIGVGLIFVTVLIAGWRWHRLLNAYGVEVDVKPLVLTSLVGQFFTLFLPGPVGDDMIRMLYISKLVKGRVGHALTSVVIDRVSGLFSILLLAAICIPMNWALLGTISETRVLAVGMLSVAGIAGISVLIFTCLKTATIRSVLDSIAVKLPRFPQFQKISELIVTFAEKRKVLGLVVLAATMTQFTMCIVYYCAGMAVGIHLPLTSWMTFVPVILASNAVPITLAGIGVRDYLVVLFLGVLGAVNETQALAASLIVLCISLILSLTGGLVYLVYRPKDSTVVMERA